MASYYARRSAVDPEWREEQIAGATERDRCRREADLDAHRAAKREHTRRCRERQRQTGKTFHELVRSTGADPAVLRVVLRDMVRRGQVDYLTTSRRYRLNGGVPEYVKNALRDL